MTNTNSDVTRMLHSRTTTTPIAAPPATEPSREQRRDERRVALQAEHWLAHQSVPEHSVLWYEHWRGWQPVVVEDATHLARLIAPLGEGDYGGIQRRDSDGPWAQVMGRGATEFMIELHPHAHNHEPGGMYFERVVPVCAAEAGALAWAWVRRDALPFGFELEPRVAPANGGFDVAL
jgi:hypothetical protein